MNKDTSGPAFPTGTGGNTPYCMGMTLRDYFAAKAMLGNLASMTEGQDFDPAMGATWAYKVADAMLESRK